MRSVKGFAAYLYNHQFVRYVFVGGTTFVIDLGVLVVCHEIFNLSIPIAASISYWTSIIWNFTMNRTWTFDAKEAKAIHEHAFFYGCLLAFNYLFTVLFMSVASKIIFYGLAKILCTGIQIIWTFPLYKYFIFKKADQT